MDVAPNGAQTAVKVDEENARRVKRTKLKQLNLNTVAQGVSISTLCSILRHRFMHMAL